MIADYVQGEGGRSYHHTAPISMMFSLHAGLGAVLDEGLDAAIARHDAAVGAPPGRPAKPWGFELFAAEGHRLPQLTTVWVPDGDRTTPGPGHTLLERYGIEIGGGLGAYAGTGVADRLHGAHRPQRNVPLLAALAEIVG